MNKRLLCLGLILCGIIGFTMAGDPASSAEGKSSKAAEAKQEPGKIELKTVKYDDLVSAVRDQFGKVVVVDIWASWCRPCMKEFPELVKLHEKYAKDGLVAMSVSIDGEEGEKAALTFLKKVKATFANYRLDEPDSFYQEKLGFKGPPVVFVFDRNGKCAGKFVNEAGKTFSYKKDVIPLVEKLMKSK